MGNTRIDLTRRERERLLAVDGDLRQVIKLVAAYVQEHGGKIRAGTEHDPRRSTHVPFDDEDWEVIEAWVQKKGRERVNHLTERRTSKRDLILHVADLILKERSKK